MFRIFVTLIVAAILTACPSATTQYLTRPDEIRVAGSYSHSPSGMTFPLMVGEYSRGSVFRFDTQGLNVSTGYSLYAPPKLIAATVYVYPSPSIVSIGSPSEVVETARLTMCKNEYEARKQEITRVHRGAKLIAESNAPSPEANSAVSGMSATFEYDGIISGVRQALQSRLDLHCYVNGKWTIKYRFTYPRNFDAMQSINEFIQQLLWPRSS